MPKGDKENEELGLLALINELQTDLQLTERMEEETEPRTKAPKLGIREVALRLIKHDYPKSIVEQTLFIKTVALVTRLDVVPQFAGKYLKWGERVIEKYGENRRVRDSLDYLDYRLLTDFRYEP